MNICYILSTSEISGGANKSFLEILKCLDRKKYNPYVILRRKGKIENTLRKLNVNYIIIPFINAVTTRNKFKNIIKKIFIKRGLYRVKKYYKKNKIDIVHNNSLPALVGMEAAMKCKIPYICHIREDIKRGLGVDFLDMGKHFEIVNNAHVIIVISNFIKEAYSNYFSNMRVLYDGLDTNQYYTKKDILNNHSINVSIYGNLDAQKDQMTAVRAMEELQKKHVDNIVLNIIGNQKTKYGLNLKKYILDNKVCNINLVDNIADSNELSNMRRKDDVNLICSNAEGLGRVTVESMLSGNLTIGANAGATSEIINNEETGLLFKVGDYSSLAECLIRVSDEREKMKTIAKNGQNYALNTFDIKKYTKRILEIYSEILEK